MSHLLLAGCGAIGSRFEAHCDLALRVVFADDQRVLPENLGVAAFDGGDLFAEKARVLAARRRARGGTGWALCGDVRYTLRPGLARAVEAAVLCLDNPAAIRDASEAIWAGGPEEIPVLVLGCGAGVEYQARLFVRPGVDPVCLFGEAERRADRLAGGASCADTTAPRASAVAAEAAAAAGAALLARWRAGDRSLANLRLQRDAEAGAEWTIQMPATPSPRCPLPHGGAGEPVVALGGNVAAVTVSALATHALDRVGDDAEILLGRRAVPLCGLYCPRCRATAPAPLRLLPAAQLRVHPCACGERARALGDRSTVGARELLDPAVGSLSLAEWGAGAGDEFVAAGRNGRVRLRCAFDWEELDDG